MQTVVWADALAIVLTFPCGYALATSVGDTLVGIGSVTDHIFEAYFLVLSRRVIPLYEQPPCAYFVSLFFCLFSSQFFFVFRAQFFS
jgi:hypothetical protein